MPGLMKRKRSSSLKQTTTTTNEKEYEQEQQVKKVKYESFDFIKCLDNIAIPTSSVYGLSFFDWTQEKLQSVLFTSVYCERQRRQQQQLGKCTCNVFVDLAHYLQIKFGDNDNRGCIYSAEFYQFVVDICFIFLTPSYTLQTTPKETTVLNRKKIKLFTVDSSTSLSLDRVYFWEVDKMIPFTFSTTTMLTTNSNDNNDEIKCNMPMSKAIDLVMTYFCNCFYFFPYSTTF